MSSSSDDNIHTLRAFAEGRCVFHTPVDRRLTVGRQRSHEPAPFARCNHDNESRVIVADRTDTLVSREHILLEPVDGDRIRLVNLSNKRSLSIEPGEVLQPGQERLIGAETRIQLENVSLRIDANRWQDKEFSALDAATIPPQPVNLSGIGSHDSLTSDGLIGAIGSSFDSSQGQVLLKWLESTAEVFQSAASSPQFLDLALRAVSQIVGLPHVVALVYEQNQWRIQADFGQPADFRTRLSTRVLEKLLDHRRTFVFHPSTSLQAMESLANIEAVVAAPILDEHGEIIGALYATRPMRLDGDAIASQITKLEARLVELLASGVAAGWARIKHEQAAIKARVQFEQFFGPVLAARLESDPELLVGRNANVSIMFCDIAGFSRISERLGPEVVLPWINEVLGAMSECVLDRNGVLVDYIGDELMAMWGAPIELLDHANRAVSAACEIISRISVLSDQWIDRLKEPFSVRIGINTGSARVGNVGSKQKFKYGALGNTVNMASRIRGATKYASCQVLISRMTADRLTDSYHLRRVGNIQVVNIEEPVEVMELMVCPDARWEKLCLTYTGALQAYEAGDLVTAYQAAQDALLISPDDHLTIELNRRIQTAIDAPAGASTIWKLEDK